MNLLIITQKINKEDPIFSFFHGWVKEFSKRFSSITVICLEKGLYDLPENVKVMSLGKEKGTFKIAYLFRFYRHIWNERNNYETVFVHMNKEYILLAGWLWLLLGKKVYFWSNHPKGDILTDIASAFCKKIFCTSKHSFTAKYEKTVFMPVGVDAQLFIRQPDILRIKNSILFLGRIAPVKKPELLIDALIELRKRQVDFVASFYGDPLPIDRDYYQSLKNKIDVAGLSGTVKFYPGVPNDKTVEIYNKHEISVNLSPSGMYDKTMFEAMACEELIIASNMNLRGNISDRFIFEEGDKSDLVLKLTEILSLNDGDVEKEAKKLREFVLSNHSLELLGKKLHSELA